jgi:hypothetical protein
MSTLIQIQSSGITVGTIPMTMLAQGNNEFACFASVIGRPTGAIIHGNPIVWEILTNTSDHGSSFIRSVLGDVSQGLKFVFPTVKNVVSFVVNGDEAFSPYCVTWGASVGVSSALAYANRPCSVGFRLQGNGTNWTAAGVWASAYSLNAFSAGLTTLNLPNSGFTACEAEAISIVYTGTNNYHIQRKYSAIGGSLGLGFYLCDNATNAVITTAPTSSDYVHISGFGQSKISVALNTWSSSNTQFGNGWMTSSFNFWCIAMFELWMKAVATSTTEIYVKWQAKSGVTSYTLKRATTYTVDVNGNYILTSPTTIYTGTALNFTDTALTTNTMYYYQLLNQSAVEISQFNTKTL